MPLSAPWQMFGPAGDAVRIHRRVLEQPDLVRRAGGARAGEGFHRLPGFDVVDEAEAPTTGREE